MDNQQGFFSRKLRAGKRRTYFFDVRATKQGDYFLTITESKRRFEKPGYDSHKIFLYKEDFKKFSEAMNESLEHIKTELNPDFDYDSYDRDAYHEQHQEQKDDEAAESPKKSEVKLTQDEPTFEINETITESTIEGTNENQEPMEW